MGSLEHYKSFMSRSVMKGFSLYVRLHYALGVRERGESGARDAQKPKPRGSRFKYRRDVNEGQPSFATCPFETRGGPPLLTREGSARQGNPHRMSKLQFGQVPQTFLALGTPGIPLENLGTPGSPWEAWGAPGPGSPR